MDLEPLNYAKPSARVSKLKFWTVAALVFAPSVAIVWYLAYVLFHVLS